MNFTLQTVVSMASLMDGGNVSSIAELMKHYSLKESLTEAAENHKTLTNNGLNDQKSGPHVTLVTKFYLCHSYQLYPSYQANLDIFDKGRILS